MRTLAPNAQPAPLSEADVDGHFTELGAVAVGRGPIGDIAVCGDAVVVTNYGDCSVSVIDADDLTVDATIQIRHEPLAAAAADHRAYVGAGSASYDCVALIETGTTTRTAIHPVALDVRSVAAHGRRVVAAGTTRGGAALAVIDTSIDRAGLIAIAAGAGTVADAVCVGPDGRHVCAAVSDAYAGVLVVADADEARVVRTIAIGPPIRDLALSPDGGTAYVLTCDRGGAITSVDLDRGEVAASVVIGGDPIQMTLSPDGTRAYIVGGVFGQEQVTVMCTVTNETLGAITVDAQPSCVAAHPDGSRLYVADFSGGLTALSVAPAAPFPPYQVMATEMIGAQQLRELEPAAV